MADPTPTPSSMGPQPLYPNLPAVTPNMPDSAPDASNLPAGSFNAQLNQQRLAAAQHAQTEQMEQQAADVAHHALFGRAVKTMVNSMGGGQIDPETGAVTKPGGFFRNLLVGALIGGAAGAERTGPGSGTFTSGFGRGVAALQANRQKQLENQLKIQQEQREQQKENREDALAKDTALYHQALTAHENLATMKDYQELNNMNEDRLAAKKAQAIAQEKQLSQMAGAQAVQFAVDGKLSTSIPVNDFMQAATKDPTLLHGADKSIERHFVVIPQTGPSERVSYNGNHWEDDDTHQPVDLANTSLIHGYDIPHTSFGRPVMTSGKDLRAQFPHLKEQWNPDQQYGITTEQWQGYKAQDAEIGYKAATSRHLDAETAKQLADVAKDKLDTKQSQLFGEALNEYNKVGGDFSKLSPKSQVVLSESTGKLITSLAAVARAQQNNGDDEDAKETYRSITQLSALVPKAFQRPGAGVDSDKIEKGLKAIAGYSLDQQKQFIQSSQNYTDAEKQELLRRLSANQIPAPLATNTSGVTSQQERFGNR